MILSYPQTFSVMQEFSDGSFGKIGPTGDIFQTLLDDPEEMEKTKAVHLGSKEELKTMLQREQSQVDRARSRDQLNRK